ncbi:unnamed protein product [Prunus brigantina]
MTGRPLELDRSPIFGDEAGALGVETTCRIEASNQSHVSKNSDSDSCMDEINTIPPSALPVPQSTRDSESSESNSDHTLFLKRHKGKLTYLIIYVDDMIVTGDDQAQMQNLQKYLASEFEMKSLGDLKYFLGIEVARSKHASVVSQFMHSPSEDHMGAVMRILKYLKVTPDKGLMFCKYGHIDVEGKKQKVVSRSSAEAEYRGMAQDVCELLWLRRLLRDLGFAPQKPMDLYCDNNAAIAIAHNPMQHDRTKHVEVD